MLIFDKSASHLVGHMIFGTSSAPHSQNVAPTVHGNLIAGVHYVEAEHKTDTRVSRDGIRETLKLGQQLVPALSEADIITSFAGILANNSMASDGDFYIAPSVRQPHVIHVIVGAPGLSAAPGIADYVINLLDDAGFKTEEKKNVRLRRRNWPRFECASIEQRQQMIAENPKHGHVLCRCEKVTEAEIREAIRNGARTMDAVKHLTRAGMGRCQGGFCATFVLEQLVEELGVAPTHVTKCGPGSQQILRSMNS
jgi:glycerol-3-phosphate dehydrogenase